VVDALHLLPYYLTQARHHTKSPFHLIPVFQCTCTHSLHPPPRPGYSFPFQLNLTACS